MGVRSNLPGWASVGSRPRHTRHRSLAKIQTARLHFRAKTQTARLHFLVNALSWRNSQVGRKSFAFPYLAKFEALFSQGRLRLFSWKTPRGRSNAVSQIVRLERTGLNPGCSAASALS